MISEFEFIEKLKTRQVKNSPKVSLGIGDDCAVLPKDTTTDLVISTDLLVEDIDFRLDWSKPEFIGHKALAVSLSDIAAMGGSPVWSMLSIGIPQNIWKTDFVERFYDGYLALADECKVELVGGDVSKTPDKIVIDSIVAGEVKKSKAVLRSGAKAGDLIFVTGQLGGAAGGLELLRNGIKLNGSLKIWQENLLMKQMRPSPETERGILIGFNEIATAMIDVSDGLSSDLRHLCRASRVGAEIIAEDIPFDSSLKDFTKTFDERIDYALHGGEDYVLLFTVDPNIFFQYRNVFEKHHFYRLGAITANSEVIELIAGDRTRSLPPRGYRHF